jgi:G3E family GTPase
MREKVPVTIVTGFLGSGKTTMLNWILKQDHGMKFAIIENEFGEVGVDDGVLKSTLDETVVEVMNGCICCTVRGDLADALKGSLFQKLQKGMFDAVIIETTGMADPAPVAQTFFVDPEVAKLYKLDGILTVVDAKHIVEHLQEEKPEGVENESVEQVAFADRIVLNKTDLVTEEELAAVQEEIRKINSSAEILPSQYSQIDPMKFCNIGGFNLDRVLEMDPEFLNTDGEHMHDSRISTCSSTFEGELNLGLLYHWIGILMRTKANDLFRYKGILAVKGKDAKFVFQGVHMLFKHQLLEGQNWEPGETRKCTFVFIGRDLDKEALTAGFQRCKVAGELRFKIGQLVVANTEEGWVPGKVVALWEEGNPYLIELENRYQDEEFAPMDSNDFVKER